MIPTRSHIRMFAPHWLLAALSSMPSVSAQDHTEHVLRAYDLTDLVEARSPGASREHEEEPPADANAEQHEAPAAPILGQIPLLNFLFKNSAPKSPPGNSPIDGIVRAVRVFADPPLSKDDVVQAVGRAGLAVRASKETHAWIHMFLERNRKEQGTIVLTEIRIYEVDEHAYSKHLAPVFEAVPHKSRFLQGKPDAQVAFLSEGNDTRRFLEGFEDAKGVSVLTAPRCAFQLASPIEITIGEQVSYVADFEIKIGKETNKVIADPVVRQLHDGIAIGGLVARLPNGRLGLDFACVRSDLERPIKTMTTSLGVGQPVTIQLPKALSTQIATSVEVAEKDIALFALPRRGTTTHDIVSVRLKLVRPDDPDIKAPTEREPIEAVPPHAHDNADEQGKRKTP
ncbi:MAG: hypothetical protein H6832_16025 [Planctomycetes bacterium]|nr:hypothetical protein [Planctomycetota bacterium]